MVLCFIYGGVSLVVFTLQTSSLIRIQTHNNDLGFPEIQLNESDLSQNRPFFQRHTINFSGSGYWGSRRTSFFYPVIIISLLGSIISILAGLSLMDLLKKKERKELTKSVIDTMTTPEEKIVIKELEESSGELTQSELVKKTNLSKVKVHRIVKRLEQLKIVSKYPYGVTNKIKLEKYLEDDLNNNNE